MRDLWARSTLGVFSGGFGALVKPHDVVFFTATLQSDSDQVMEEEESQDESDGYNY